MATLLIGTMLFGIPYCGVSLSLAVMSIAYISNG
jgi:hypothetical protein